MTWLAFILMATALFGLRNVIDKILLNGKVRSPPAIVAFFGFPAILAFLALLTRVSLEFSLIGFWATSLGAMWLIAVYFFCTAIGMEEISRIVPLLFLKPVLVLLLATIFLGEIFGPLKYLGIVLVLGGAVLLSFRRKEKLLEKISGLRPLALAVGFFAILDILLKTWFNFSGLQPFDYALHAFLGVAIASLSLWLLPEVRSAVNPLESIKFTLLLGTGTFYIVGTFLYITSISLGPVSLVTSVNSTQSLFVLFYATLLSLFFPDLYKEENNKKTFLVKIAAILLIVFGVYLVS